MAKIMPPGDDREDEIFDCFAGDETETLKLSPKLWVELKKEPDYGEENDLVALRFAKPQLNDDGETVFSLDGSRYNLSLMAIYVVDWNLTDSEGKSVRLPRKLAERIAVMRRLNKVVGEKILGRIIEMRNEAAAAEAGDGEQEADEEELDPLSDSDSDDGPKST